jgi:hypothetical protein
MYQSIYYHKPTNIVHVFDDTHGHQQIPWNPYAYIPSANGEFTAVDGTRLTKVSGDHKNNPKCI